jgi:hypothetical protein
MRDAILIPRPSAQRACHSKVSGRMDINDAEPGVRAPLRHHAPAPLGWTDGALELLKWIALASMFVDHFGRHWMGHPQDGWVFAAGRVAFPLFAVVLGLNLAREGDRPRRAARTAMRLALWCAIALLPSIWARGDPMVVNVLGTLGLGAAVCWAIDSDGAWPLRLLACMAVAAAALVVEFGVAGVFLAPAVYLAASRRDPGFAVLAAVLLGAVGWLNASFGGAPALAGTLAGIVLAVVLRRVPVRVPRAQWFFYVTYPLHLALIGALKHFG